MIFVLDTATEKVFLGLWDKKWLAKTEFLGGRELNSLIIKKLEDTFSHSSECENVSECFSKLTGIVVNEGPGSFTGLRIGLSVANTIAYTQDVPIVGIKSETDTEKLLQKGLSVLESRSATFEEAVAPFYGAEPNITAPRRG